MKVNRLFTLWLLGIAVLSSLMTQSARPALAQGITINSIQIIGLENLDERIILDTLSIKPGQPVTGNVVTELDSNSRALYDTGYFLEPPRLSLDYYEEKTILVVEVLENPPFKKLVITGSTIYPLEELQAGFALTPGEVINVRQVEQQISEVVLNRYQEDGYIGAYVVDFGLVTTGEELGTIYLTIGEGAVKEFLFEGNEKTKDSLLRMIISRHISPGDVLQRDKLERVMQDFYNLGIFEQVEPSIEPSEVAGNINLKITVVEAPTGQAGVGLGYSTVNGVQGSLSFQERNFGGRAQTVSALVVFSKNNPGYELSYSNPYLGPDNFFSSSLYDLNYRQQRNPGTPIESELDVDSTGGSFSFGTRFSEVVSGSVGLGVVDYDYNVVKGDPFAGFGPERRTRLQEAGQTRSVNVSLNYDTRDNIYSSTKGTFLSGSTQIAGFGGDFNFRKYVLEARQFFPRGKGQTFGVRGRIGVAEGQVPIFEEFRLGGVFSVRGLPEDALTGTKSLLFNAEYRYPLDKEQSFVAVAFTDWASVGESFSEMETGYGAGIGIRFRVPALGLGALRLDLGWDLKDGGSRLHFGIGEMF